MAPSGRRRAKTTRKSRRTQLKKQQSDQSKKQEIVAISPVKNSGDGGFTGVSVDDMCAASVGCSTPKAKRFQIPEILTCPPAPMKRRPVLSNYSLRRKPIAFYSPPDLELFFVYAALGRDASV